MKKFITFLFLALIFLPIKLPVFCQYSDSNCWHEGEYHVVDLGKYSVFFEPKAEGSFLQGNPSTVFALWHVLKAGAGWIANKWDKHQVYSRSDVKKKPIYIL